MKYNVNINESNLVLSADDSDVFFSEFAKLPEGEYTVSILSDESHSREPRRRKLSNDKVAAAIGIVIEFVSILLMIGCIIPLWIIGCALM